MDTGTIELTELEKLEVTRVDAVSRPANGFPVLIMKGIAEPEPEPEPVDDEPEADPDPEPDREAAKALAKAILADLTASPGELFKAVGKRGQVDEAPDVDLGDQIIALLFRAIIAEAQEGAAGSAGEVCDIQELACALQAVRCWRDGEQAAGLGDVMPASMLMQSAAEGQSAAKGILATVDAIFSDPEVARCVYEEVIAKAKHSAEDRRRLADEGKALPDGSYPITDAEDLHSAAVLARSGHGDVAAAKKLIARRAKELGVPNPLDVDDTAKSQIAPEVPAVDTVTQETGGLTKAVEDAIAKATAPLQERIASLDAELAKVKAAPVPSGLVLSRNVQVKTPGGGAANEDLLAKAAYYRQKAADAVAPVDRESYLALARETEQAARTKSA